MTNMTAVQIIAFEQCVSVSIHIADGLERKDPARFYNLT